MKKFNFSGVKSLLFVMVIVLSMSCSKSDSAGGGSGPTPPPAPSPAINLPAPPTNPLWFGGSYNGNYSVSNPGSLLLYIDGVQSSVSGTISLTNLQASKSIRFDLKKSDGTTALLSKTLEIPVYSLPQTNIQKYGSWVEYKQEEDISVDHSGVFQPSTVPICDQDDVNTFNNATGECTTDRGPMECGLQDGTAAFNFQTVNGQLMIEWKIARLKTVTELTPTSFVFIERVFDFVLLREKDVKHYLKH